MREPKYRVEVESGDYDDYQDAASAVTLHGFACPLRVALQHPGEVATVEIALKRIAVLLTANDERIAREGHRERCKAAGLTPSNGAVSDATWVDWSSEALLLPQRASLADLDALEAAYHATLVSLEISRSITTCLPTW